jgi:hypothetical protein
MRALDEIAEEIRFLENVTGLTNSVSRRWRGQVLVQVQEDEPKQAVLIPRPAISIGMRVERKRADP